MADGNILDGMRDNQRENGEECDPTSGRTPRRIVLMTGDEGDRRCMYEPAADSERVKCRFTTPNDRLRSMEWKPIERM